MRYTINAGSCSIIKNTSSINNHMEKKFSGRRIAFDRTDTWPLENITSRRNVIIFAADGSSPYPTENKENGFMV